MQIDHIALYTRDLERLCEFYTKYFDGTAGKLYQNEETGTQACFVSFADGARLEIVTRPQFEDAEHSRLWTGWAHHRGSIPHPAQHAVRCGTGKTADCRRQDISVQLR